MVDFIGCMFLLALFLLCFYYDRKEKKRKEHEDWIYDCRQCLFRIANSFRRDCHAIAEDAFAKYTNILQHKSYRHMPDYMTNSFLSDYLESLDSLKEDYLGNVPDKVKETMRYYTFTSIPDFLIEEYSKLISDIYNTFWDFGHLMWMQIQKPKEESKERS